MEMAIHNFCFLCERANETIATLTNTLNTKRNSTAQEPDTYIMYVQMN